MKKTFLLIYITLAIALTAGAKTFTVIDASDKSPVIGATVIGKTGVIKGLTDNNGHIIVDDAERPVTIRSIGYNPAIVSELNDTIALEPAVYEINEIVVNPVDRPVKRVICFAREYSSGITGPDTMQFYCEYMAEAFLADGKIKGYRGFDAKPKPKGYKRYARITKNGADSVFSPKYDDDITGLAWFDIMAFIPNKKLELPATILEGADCDTVPGKFGPQFVYKRKNGQFTMTADVLSNHKNRRWSPFIFKLIGMTTDITDCCWTMSYADNEANSFGINEFASGVYNIHLIGKGKWIKKLFGTKEPIEMDAYLEVYPIEITNLTIDEYKELRDDYSRIPFQYPYNIQPISPAIDSLVKRIEIE